MKVILKQDVKGVGKKDQVINAADGYARNFLLPRGLAVPADTGNMNNLKAKSDANSARKERDLKEVYNVDTFLDMLEGGKKTHQRKQYETYQNMYISSKYFGNDCQIAELQFRPNTENARDYSLPMKMYADCYVRGSLGKGTGVGS